VLVRVMVCCVEVGPGTLLKMSAAGLSERPGSGVPNPVSAEVTGVEPVGRLRTPVRWPVAVGAKTMLRKQEALGAREPLQAGPPVGAEAAVVMAKSPVTVGIESATVEEVRLVRVKRVGALELWTGMLPKSCVTGARMRPVRGRPVPVRVSGDELRWWRRG
jgi:hypothetical protein